MHLCASIGGPADTRPRRRPSPHSMERPAPAYSGDAPREVSDAELTLLSRYTGQTDLPALREHVLAQWRRAVSGAAPVYCCVRTLMFLEPRISGHPTYQHALQLMQECRQSGMAPLWLVRWHARTSALPAGLPCCLHGRPAVSLESAAAVLALLVLATPWSFLPICRQASISAPCVPSPLPPVGHWGRPGH